MDNPNISNNEALYRSQIREFFEDRFGTYRNEGHYTTELKVFRNQYAGGEEGGDTTEGNYGSYDAIYATRKDVIIGFIEYWLTEGYQRFNRHNKFIIDDKFAIYEDTNFTTIYDEIIDSFNATELKQIATQEFAKKIVLPNWLKITSTRWKFVANTIDNTLITLEYSTDGITWTTLPNDTTITVSAYIRGDNTRIKDINTSVGIGTFSSIRQSQFIPTYSVSGSVQSLIYGDDTENQYIACDHCFENLFNGDCDDVTSKLLPAIYLKPYCYCKMFLGSKVRIVPDLPATTLAEHCYDSMFNSCNSITSINPLPATTLAPYCYSYMFYNCAWLAQDLSEDLSDKIYLPATKMEEGCYSGMFYGCLHLEKAPMLPAYKLAKNCYYKMFLACISLTQAPELPATELAPGCYDSMFDRCISLEIAPELPAKKLVQQCYSSMFNGCTHLKYVKALFTEITYGTTGAINSSNTNIPHSSLRGWLSSTNTNSTSQIILHTDLLYSKDYENWYSDLNLSSGNAIIGTGEWSLIPTNWQVYGTRNYLHFKPSPESNCKNWNLVIHIMKFNNGNPIYYNGSYLDFNYRTTPYDISVNTSTGAITEYSWTHLTNGYIDANDAQENQTVPDTEGSSPLISIPFSSDGIYICNALDYEDRDPEIDRRWIGYISIDVTYYTHFNCIPQNTSTPQYIDMFGDLRSIFYTDNTFGQYDELPNLTYHKYFTDYSRPGYMFFHNTYLRHCYTSCNVKQFTANMYEAAFGGCTNLIYLPNLGINPSVPLNYCTFNSSFGGCTSLEYVPELPYLTYAEEDWTNDGQLPDGYNIGSTYYKEVTGCYASMFYSCPNIKYVPNIFPLRHLCKNIYAGGAGMFGANYTDYQNGIYSSLTRTPEIIAVSADISSCYAIFAWNGNLKEIQCALPIVYVKEDSLKDMYVGSAIRTPMHLLPALTVYNGTYVEVFGNCKKLAVAPKIQAITIGSTSTNVMEYLFSLCRNLTYVNTSLTQNVSVSPFLRGYTGSSTLKDYTTRWEFEDKAGMLYVHTGQYEGLSQGYYKAALLQYSLNPETNKYDFDGEYWIYVKSRKFADGNTYYIWRKYYEDATGGDISSGSLYTSDEYTYFYLITKECIIPSCTVTSFSSAWSYNPTSITTKYTVIGYAYADFNHFNEFFENGGDFAYTGEASKTTHSAGPRVYPKVLVTIAEQPQPD